MTTQATNNEKVALKVAQADIDSWLNLKGITGKKREANSSAIETLVDAVVSGHLSYDAEKKTLTQVLRFPLTGKDTENPVTTDTLTFKSRITQGEVSSYLKNVNATDAFALIRGYVRALTTQPGELLDQMDTVDYSLAQAIAGFFL